MTAVSQLLSAIEALMPTIEPHPDLVASTVPTSRQVNEAVAVMGFYPSDDDRPTGPCSARGWRERQACEALQAMLAGGGRLLVWR